MNQYQIKNVVSGLVKREQNMDSFEPKFIDGTSKQFDVQDFNSALGAGKELSFDLRIPNFDNFILQNAKEYERLQSERTNKKLDNKNSAMRLDIIYETPKGNTNRLVLIVGKNGKWIVYDENTKSQKKSSTNSSDLFQLNVTQAPPVQKQTDFLDDVSDFFNFSDLTQGNPTDPEIQKIVDRMGKTFGISQNILDVVAHWFTNNPRVGKLLLGAGAAAAVSYLAPLLFGAGGVLSGILGGGVVKYAAIGALLIAFGPQIMQALQGVGSSIGGALGGGGLGSLFGGGIVPGAMGALFGSETMGTYIAYDGGKEVDNKSTAPYQRCLIRLGKGNLAMERANLQLPAYNPVIGIKIPGKKNYADDGRFGKWTLDASRNLFQVINDLNKDKIKDNPKFEIKDPARVPVEILISPACAGNTQMNPTAAEQQAFEATKKVPAKKPEPKNLPESKVYKDYGFLSTKNEKLHSVLMEQLKKDLKRG